jgi:class 3 adenylate cyclase/tetratricopeptide (TPR) repeat protein
MDAERWQQIQDVLADAIDWPIAERSARLDTRCGDDLDLRREVESLLVAHDATGPVDDLGALVSPLSTLIPKQTQWSGRRTARYVVEDALGAGGMSVVYRARDERLGRQVALKFLPPHLSAVAQAKARLISEARAAAALDHPGLCTIYEIDETEDGQLFIAMALYEGETLQARLERGRLTFDEALPIALQVARALGYAHDAGVVHRDIKPSNIMLLPDGAAKVLDFGIAQIVGQTLVDPAALIGTVPYMSPEQASGGSVGRRSDIWSLGIVVHEMLTGARPFQRQQTRAVVEAILAEPPRLTASSYPDVPGGLDRVLERALAKAPEDRYPSMALFATDLSALTAAPGTATEHARGEGDAHRPISATERRHAAVLVTSISDYPALMDCLAPTDAQRVVAQVRAAAVDVMSQYGGLVNQAIGEEIVSVFGVPIAHDDDGVRAVRAALDLHARMCSGEGLTATPSAKVQIQSGIHVGPVVARRLNEGPRRYDIVGAAATVAARLAALAGPGAVLITPEARRLAGSYVETTDGPSVVLDSHGTSVTSFRVLGETGVATSLEASSRAGLTPYVGRDAELSQLHWQVVNAARSHGAVVSVSGEAGAGKSRLLYELVGRVTGTSRTRVLKAACRAYGDSVPYGVPVQILLAALELTSPIGRADEIADRIRRLDPSLEPFVPLFLHVLCVTSDRFSLPRHLQGEHLQAAMLDAFAALVEVLSRGSGLVVAVEDWQWADTGSRAACLRIAELVGTKPIVLVVTTRSVPGEPDAWPAHATRLRLEPLDFAASLAIVQSILGGSRTPDTLARRLYDRAGGNPFFLEQLCAALLERHDGSLGDTAGTANGGEGDLSLPDTVQGVIRARLDNLDAHARGIVRIAAVIGAEFDHELLATVAPSDVDFGPAIAALKSAGLVQQTTAAAPVVYRFTHALTQEVCYDSLVGHQRKVLHGSIGRALAAAHVGGADEEPGRLAHHFGCAEDWPAAVRFGIRAADRAVALSQFADALGTLDQVLDWVSHLDGLERADLTADVLLRQERLCETLGLRARQQDVIDSLIKQLALEGSSPRLAEVYLRQGDLSVLLKRFDAADRALGTALRIAQECQDATLVRSALRSLGLLRWHEGRHAEALRVTRQVLALDREGNDPLAIAVSLTNLGNILKATGDHAAARTTLEEALAMPALRDDPKKLVYTLHMLANVYRAVGDLDRALDCLLQNDEIARVHLLPIQRSFHLTSIAHIQLQRGQLDAALETYRTAVELSRRARHADGLVQSLRMLGNALFGLGRYDEALPCLQEAAQLFAQLEDRVSEAEMRSVVARIVETRSPGDAVQAWSQALALHRTLADFRNELEAREGLARAMRARGDDAVVAFESALALAMTIGERTREVALRNTLGILEFQRGSFQHALAHYESALALVRDDTDSSHKAVLLNSAGAALTRLGRPAEARTVLEESLAISRRTGESQLEAHALAALGQVLLSVHDVRGAADYFERSRVVRESIGDSDGERSMARRLAELQERSGVQEE